MNWMRRWLTPLVLPAMAYSAGNYATEKLTDRGVEIIRLTDAAHAVSVSIAPSLRNRAFELKVHGKNLLYFPSPDIVSFRNSGAKGLNGTPFLAPLGESNGGRRVLG